MGISARPGLFFPFLTVEYHGPKACHKRDGDRCLLRLGFGARRIEYRPCRVPDVSDLIRRHLREIPSLCSDYNPWSVPVRY